MWVEVKFTLGCASLSHILPGDGGSDGLFLGTDTRKADVFSYWQA